MKGNEDMKNLFGGIVKFFTKVITIGGSQLSVGTIASTAIVAISLVGGTAYVATNHLNMATTNDVVASETVMFEDTTNVLDGNVYSEAIPNEETYIFSEDGLLHIPTTINDEEGNEYNLNEKDIHIHSLERTVELEATCISEGYGTEYCTDCDYSAEYTIPATNSHLVSWTVVLEQATIVAGKIAEKIEEMEAAEAAKAEEEKKKAISSSTSSEIDMSAFETPSTVKRMFRLPNGNVYEFWYKSDTSREPYISRRKPSDTPADIVPEELWEGIKKHNNDMAKSMQSFGLSAPLLGERIYRDPLEQILEQTEYAMTVSNVKHL